jgi:hypothetical protein
MDQIRILIIWFLLYYPGSSITRNQNIEREKLITNRNYKKKKKKKKKKMKKKVPLEKSKNKINK